MATAAASSTWDVVATVRAPSAYVQAFIDVYRRLGADKIHLYYDDPGLAFSFGGPDLIETVCNAAHWKGKRAKAVEKRQMANATLAARVSTADWVLHCDIDEHLHAGRRIADILGQVPATCGCYTALPVEAVFITRPATVQDIFATPYFKSLKAGWKPSSAFWSTVYGDLSAISLAGFWGHRIGKSFIRRSRLDELESMPIHMPSGAFYRKMSPLKSKEIVLRHYDALLPEEWVRKHTDRVNKKVKAVWAGDRRNQQSRLVADAVAQGGTEAAFGLYDRMFVIDPALLAAGTKAGAVRVVPPDPPALLADTFAP